MNKWTVSVCLFVGAGAACLCTSASAVSVIDTASGWNGGDAIYYFGEGSAAETFGQTFTVSGPETSLDDFTFYLNDYVDPEFFEFQAYIYAWNGDSATGPQLFNSGLMSSSNNGGSNGMESFTINTGGLALNDGDTYVAFFSVSEVLDSVNGRAKVGIRWSESYAGGRFVAFDNGSNFNSLLTSNWDQFDSYDLAFTMNFSEPAPVPEPTTLTLSLMGLALVCRRAMRKDGQ